MPANFAEVWSRRVIQHLNNLDQAPWLDGIAELDTRVIEAGSGSASETNIIHIPRTNFNPDVLVNNSAYPIALQAYNDDEVTVQLDKYQTKVTTLSDDQIVGASYPRIDFATSGHVRSITSKKYQKAIHAIAPASDAVDTPVIEATGDVGPHGMKRLIYDDLVTLKDRLDTAEVDASDRRLVLCSRHWNDLLIDRKNFGDKLVNYNSGQPAPVIAGFTLYEYMANPHFSDAGVKLAFGSVPVATDRQASIVFWKNGIAKKTGMTKQYFNPAKNDPENQTNKLNYRHYFIALPFEAKYIGAIY